MKKSLIAAGVIVALGVVWTGGAWYTGKQLETHMTDMLAKANAQIKRTSSAAGLELVHQNYHRGLFSSQLDLVIKPVDGATQGWLKPGQTIVMKESIDHGPFPLAALKSFNLMPMMASVKTVLVNNAVTKPLFDLANGQSFVESDTRISYNGDTRSLISLKPLNREAGQEKLSLSGGEFTFDADRDGTAFALSGSVPSALIETVNENGMRVKLTLDNLTTEGASKVASFDEYVGNQKIALDKLAISMEGVDLGQLEGLTVEGRADLAADGKTVNSQIDYTLNSLKLKNQDMGSGKLTLKVGNIDGAIWHEFNQTYNAKAQKVLQEADLANNPEAYQQQAAEALLSSLPILLKAEPVITVAPLSWKNSKGEATFNLSLFLRDPAKTTQPPQTLAGQVDTVVKNLDTKLVIPMDMATEFMTQSAGLEGYKPEDAAKLAQQQVKGLSAMGQMFHLTTEENNSITSSLQYTAGQVTLNGQKMSLEEFVGMFGGVLNLQAPDAPQE
ncbi:YdgA family protein [Trabulsiella odontotermitis]|uniref:YdgA family protein n=1 Tax=Trabulsiella odontotermitis TaxID=379893 RepID=UPI0006BA667D|nr:YdgA family protein [Trabulsiella odontotermitis]